MKFTHFSCTAALLFAVALASTARAEEPPLFQNPDLPVEKRVDDLIGRLNTEEKISQLMMNSPAIPRLGVHAYHWWNEALHGVARNGTATVFPQAIALAATWSPELHEKIADAISTEARAKNNEIIRKNGGDTGIYQGLTIWSPNINIFRDPRWGRGQETYGEDPFLTGRMGVAFVKGLQGNDPNYLKTVGTLKHYAVHSGPEQLRHTFDAKVSERDLRETYLPAFEAGIREGGAQSLMSAYNAINGIPAPANTLLLTDILRKEWGFKGAVVGDVDTVGDISGRHRYVKTPAEGSALALKAGNDLCSGTTYNALKDSLKQGLVTEADMDVALRRLLRLRFMLGQFDPADRVPYAKIPISENDSPAHNQLALEAARQSLVLLKNDGTLPWDAKSIKTLAVLGPTADDGSALLGNYSGSPSHPVTILKGLKNKLEPMGVKVLAEKCVPLVAGFHETGQPFPEGVVFTDETKSTPGFKGEIFDNAKFEGAPRAVRTDAQLDLLWNEAQPIPDIPVKGAHVRWTGVIIPPVTGEYALTFSVLGGEKVWINDKPVLTEEKPHNPDKLRNASIGMALTAGEPCRVRIEFYQIDTAPSAQIQFGWRAPEESAKWIATAEAADHILLTLGITPQLEGEQMTVTAPGFDGGDRTTVLLPKSQRDLIDQIAALKKPFTVVFTGGSAISFDPGKPNAALFAWYYGQRGGDAVTEALLGEINPGGRLPITFYQNDADLPPFEDYSMANRTYRYFTGKPLFAFGYGLSYTMFSYGAAKLSAASVKASDTVTLTVEVTNTGSRDGDEVVQVYARNIASQTPQPIHSLVAFKRVPIPKGQTVSVPLSFPASQLRIWDSDKKAYVVDPGAYEIQVGSASDNLPLKMPLKVTR